MQRSLVLARADLLVGLRRLGERQLLGERDDAVELRSVLLQPIEIHLREVGGGDLSTLDEWSQRGDREECEIVERGSRRGGRLEGHFDLRARRRARLGLPAREVRTEGDGRLRVERNVDRAQLLEGVEVAVDAAERLRLFGIGEVDAEDLLAALQRVLADALGLLLRLLRQRRQSQAASDGGRHGLEETSAANTVLTQIFHACSSPTDLP